MSECLIVVNPKIEKYTKKYIWGMDKESLMIFAELTSCRIPVNGFISNDENEVGMSLYNKPVISLDMIEDKEETLIIADQEIQSDVSEELVQDFSVITELFTIPENLRSKKVVIYGAGYIGETLVSWFADRGIKIDYFLDKNKYGQMLSGIPIYHPQKIEEMDDNFVIIEAGKYWQEMEDTIRKVNLGIQTFYINKFDKFKHKLSIRIKDNRHLNLHILWNLTESFPDSFPDKKVIMVGNDVELAMGYKEVLECLGYKNVSVMVTEETKVCQDVPLLDEVLYEENYLLILYELKRWHKIIEKIEELGIEDTAWTPIESLQPLRHEKGVVDVNLGHSFQMNYIPGLYLHGEKKENNVKIVTLGGSTTYERLYFFRSWPKIMYEKYCGRGKNITLYNGGIGLYTSMQELIKLGRDILYLEPDIVIVLDGFNDIHFSSMEFHVLYESIKYAMENANDSLLLYTRLSKEIFRGIESNDIIRKWLNNVESMYAITSIRNIKFHSFMQPMAVSQKINIKHGLTIKKMAGVFFPEEEIRSMKLFREYAKDIEKTHPYMHDLTHIFDEKDVYMDTCHVWESGNEIIADAIWQVIEPDVREIMEMKSNILS